MITVRRSEERGHAKHGWLESRHTFSFADYHDPEYMGFRRLRVINEDKVAPAKGFASHSHRDMEIVSYVIDGALEHRDSMGNGSVIRPGDVQTMRAGTGVTHSEFNSSPDEPVHFLQIWILPDRAGLPPAYGQTHFPVEERRGRLKLVVSSDGREGSLEVRQDASIYACLLATGETVTHTLAEGRAMWLQLVRGSVNLNDVALAHGDGAAVSGEAACRIWATGAAEFLLFDLGPED